MGKTRKFPESISRNCSNLYYVVIYTVKVKKQRKRVSSVGKKTAFRGNGGERPLSPLPQRTLSKPLCPAMGQVAASTPWHARWLKCDLVEIVK